MQPLAVPSHSKVSRKSIEEQIHDLETLIRDGAGTLASQRLKALLKNKIDRQYLPKISNFAKRLAQFEIAARVLYPIVRPSGHKKVDSSPEERLHYAAALNELGATAEAKMLYESIDPREEPNLDLFYAHCLFSEWNYKDAISHLNRFIETANVDSYLLAVGKVNLAAALVYERDGGARGFVEELLELTTHSKFRLLRGATLGIAAQWAIHEQSWSEAHHHLNESKSILVADQNYGALFTLKWKVLLALKRYGYNDRTRSLLQEVRKHAALLRVWETVREVDKHWALSSENEDLFWKVYFGTSYPDYRIRLLKDAWKELTPPQEYIWSFTDSPRHIVDLCTMKPGKMLHQTLLALTQDFYRPMRLATLHHALWPGDYYNPLSSPKRVHRLILRTRSLLEEEKIPLVINEEDTFYKLEALEKSGVGIKVSFAESKDALKMWWVPILRQKFGTKNFSAREASFALNVTYMKSLGLLKEGIQAQRLSTLGNGSATRYQFSGND